MTAYGRRPVRIYWCLDAEWLNGVDATWTYLRTLGVAATNRVGTLRRTKTDRMFHGLSYLVIRCGDAGFQPTLMCWGTPSHSMGILYTIIGVLPVGFEFPDSRRAKLPMPVGN